MEEATGPVLALTTGEPAGIGPELAVMLVDGSILPALVVAVGDPVMLADRAARIGRRIEVIELGPGEPVPAPRVGGFRYGRWR